MTSRNLQDVAECNDPSTTSERDPVDDLRLLIVEDNPINQKVAAKALLRLGFTADVTNDGREAVEAVKRRRYALILMDCMMPEMDGYEATRAIRALEAPGQHVPILAFTADKTAGTRERCLEAGMDDYLTKPVDLGVLREALGRWLGEPPVTGPSAVELRRAGLI